VRQPLLGSAVEMDAIRLLEADEEV